MHRDIEIKIKLRMTFLCIYCNTLYFPLFHANTRGGNRLTRDTICATYTVAAVSAFFDRRR